MSFQEAAYGGKRSRKHSSYVVRICHPQKIAISDMEGAEEHVYGEAEGDL